MTFSKEEIQKRLQYLTHEELVDLVTRLYRYFPNVQSEINRVAVTRDDSNQVLGNIEKYSPGECKKALSEYVKGTRDRKEKVLRYFSFIENILEKRDTLDFRFISVASASFGKAMEILGKDKNLWEEMIDRAYSIAGVFYEMNGAVAYKAVEYYVAVKRSYEKG